MYLTMLNGAWLKSKSEWSCQDENSEILKSVRLMENMYTGIEDNRITKIMVMNMVKIENGRYKEEDTAASGMSRYTLAKVPIRRAGNPARTPISRPSAIMTFAMKDGFAPIDFIIT